ncbi:hypothetical protein NX059_007842 [Plenodomus lindquistii]|nr:hypothetical protein NX059_007842 [Plenodomus lindquistii]
MSVYNPLWGPKKATHKKDIDSLVKKPSPTEVALPTAKPTVQTQSGDAGVHREDVESPDLQAPAVHEYDVYARPFVPSILRTINNCEAQIITTPPRHCIDYRSYTQSFMGTDFFPVPISIMAEPGDSDDIISSMLSETSYPDYFNALIGLESAAKAQENESHALYELTLYRVDIPLDGQVWALSVPGLREDLPLLEMGDVVQVRQLWVDHTGRLPLPPYGYAPSHFEEIALAGVFWNGIQYDASVQGVNRAGEMVYLRVNELNCLHHGASSVAVNVVIPLKTAVIEGQRRALAAVSQQLRQIVRPRDDQVHDQENLSMILNGTTESNEEAANDWTRRMLFPIQTYGQLQTRLRNVPHRALFDPAVNYEQAHAVNDICVNEYGTLPYLISGPPGTGKTKTLVEIAMQLLNSTDIAHILICAPSEAAADTLALRLKEYLSVKQLLRLNRPGRADNEVPSELTQYCYMKRDMYYLPPFKTLMAYNVVVTSCRDAAMLAEAHITNSHLWTMERAMYSAFHPEAAPLTLALHWGALLIDEAAQATEIDILPAINIVCPPLSYAAHLLQPRFVMAGDEHQLGPRTSSQDSRVSQSLFARLSARPLYASHPLSRSNSKPSSGPPVLKKSMLPITYPPFTNLVRNYRSHPAILSVPSALFYNNTLIPEAPSPSTPLQSSPLWRGRKWPVLFLPHTRPDEIEREGGGWYNLSEARIACSLANSLVYEAGVKQDDVCIISPFAAQVKMVRSLMRSSRYGGGSGLWDVNIGPLEAFQGLEKRVVVLCTTRTRERFLEMDRKRGLGVVFQPRRMNVALTRAKEGLIVIGNPEILGKDEHWRAWMAFCWRNELVGMEGGSKWEGPGEADEGKAGVLEKALVAREKQGRGEEGKLLGKGVDDEEGKDRYEEWVESFREILEEEANRDEAGHVHEDEHGHEFDHGDDDLDKELDDEDEDDEEVGDWIAEGAHSQGAPLS